MTPHTLILATVTIITTIQIITKGYGMLPRIRRPVMDLSCQTRPQIEGELVRDEIRIGARTDIETNRVLSFSNLSLLLPFSAWSSYGWLQLGVDGWSAVILTENLLAEIEMQSNKHL